jgi:hypothetical protein
MKQYMLSVCAVDGAPAPSAEATEKMFSDVGALNDEMRSAGAWVFAGGMDPISSSTVVRIQDGAVLTTDGPFAEGKEYVGGFWVIKAEDLDAAIAWAAKGTRACGAPVEVRPFQEATED